MARVDAGKAATKWGRVTPGRREDYIEGVKNPTKDWAEETTQAADAYREGIEQAIADDRFRKGVERTGTPEWQRQTLQKGPGRWAQGVSGAVDKYQRGFAPYADVLSAIELPPRAPKGDPRNLERVRLIVEALRAKKLELQSRM